MSTLVWVAIIAIFVLTALTGTLLVWFRAESQALDRDIAAINARIDAERAHFDWFSLADPTLIRDGIEQADG